MTSGKILQKAATQWLPAVAVMAVILHYALFIYWHAVNIPYADDLYDVLQVLTGAVQSNDLQQTFHLLFAQYFNHRTLSNRLIYYLALLKTGEVNFRTTLFLANLVLPLLLVLFYLTIRHQTHRWLVLLSAALILFGLRTHELSLWTAPMDDMFVYAYGFASLICLRKVGLARFLAALVFASLGTFTLANGQFIWLVGFGSLLHQSLILRRASMLYALGWLLSAVIILIVWRMGFEAGYTVPNMLQILLATPLHPITYFFTLMGNAVSGSSILLAASAGCVMLCVISYSTVRRFRQENLTLELFAWYLVFSLLAVTFGRAVMTELEYALSSRYALPSELLLITIIAGLAYHLPARRQNLITYSMIVLICAVSWGTSFQTYRPILQHMLEKRVASYNRGIYWAYGAPKEETRSIVATAVSLGIYNPPTLPHPQPNIAPSSNKEKRPSSLRKTEK
jgi:hypothetical protein